MNGLNEGARRRGHIRVPVTPARWGTTPLPLLSLVLFVLFAVVSCCSPGPLHESGAAGAPAHRTAGTATASAHPVSAVPHVPAPPTADSPRGHGTGNSCHGTTEHTTPVVLPAPAAPASLPGDASAAHAVPLTGATAIRGPSDETAEAVDRHRLQVQRI